MLKVLITGITGFLGSHIAETLLEEKGVQISGLRRQSSDLWRCKSFKEKINWICTDDDNNWLSSLDDIKPNIIIHCAWTGVNAVEREDWDIQSQNIEFLLNLLIKCNEIGLNKFIFLGSQSEYGDFSGKIKEDDIVNPKTAYAYAKLSCLELLNAFAQKRGFDWLWLRVFSIFGEKEANSWLIPSLIQKMKSSSEMDFTSGEQKYGYMYVKDFCEIIHKIVLNKVSSGIYNISSNKIISIRELVTKIRDHINPSFKLNFGKIPYRKGQSMHMEGDINKLENEIGKITFTDFNFALMNVINKY